MVLIEMNPRVSRSSALASKATGFPIAKIAALLAVGYRLDEITNDITGETPAAFEPTLDYVVVKIPRFAFEKFPGADHELTTTMKSVGEAMAIGRTFKEAFLKAFRSLELGSKTGTLFGQESSGAFDQEDDTSLQQALGIPTDRRMPSGSTSPAGKVDVIPLARKTSGLIVYSSTRPWLNRSIA